VLAAAYALLLLCCLKDVANPDAFWHLSAGARILAEHAVPRADWLSFTRAGMPWTDFEWGQEALWALLFRAGGWWALIAWKTALFAGGAALVERALARRGVDARARACAVALLAAGLGTVGDLRADNISFFLFCGTLAALEGLRGGRRAPRAAALAAAGAAGGALWANMHGAFVVGLAAIAGYALLSTGAARRRCAALLAGAAAGTLLTPYGPSLYRVFLEHARAESVMAAHIVEWHWASPDRVALWPFWLLALWSLWALRAARPRRADAAPWALLAGLFVLGLRHQRDTPYFVAAAVLLPALALRRARRLSPPRAAAPVCVLAAAALLAVLPQDITRSGLRESKFPAGAAAYLEAHPETAALKLYNPWDWGGYLGWRLKAPYRVFYDGRYIFHDLLGRTLAATRDPLSWNAFLDAQGLDGALLKRDQPDMRVRLEGLDGKVTERVLPYEVLFMPRQRWNLLYEDDQSALYVRRK
jgi:hypothetical protein